MQKHRLVVPVSELLLSARKSIIANTGNQDTMGYAKEDLLALALEEKRAAGWCDSGWLQLSADDDQKYWVAVFHFHGHRFADAP